MTNYNVTISNSIRAFGPEPTEKWGAMTWGVDKWGYGSEDLVAAIGKLIASGVAPTSDVIQLVAKLIASSQTVSGAALAREARKLISNAESMTGAALYRDLTKLVANAESVTGADLARDVGKYLDDGLQGTTEISKVFDLRLIENAVLVSGDMASEKIYDRAGYERCFTGGIAEGEDRIDPDPWTKETDPTDGFAAEANPATTWTEG